MSQADHADLSCPSIGSAQSNLHLGLPDMAAFPQTDNVPEPYVAEVRDFSRFARGAVRVP